MNKWNTIYNENYNLTKLKFKVKQQYNLVYHNSATLLNDIYICWHPILQPLILLFYTLVHKG